MDRKWYFRPGFLVAAGVFLLAIIVYTRTLAPTISFWDCAEYITTSHIVGIPHQPGTPLYVLVGRVFDVLLGQADIEQVSLRTAWAVNFMSAFFSALAVMLIYLIVARVARRADADSGWLAHAGGVVGALFLLFSETFWNNAVEAEVYGLAAFMMALLTWLALLWYDKRTEKQSDWVLLLLVYLFGLGVGFHLGSLLVFPGIFLLVFLANDRQLPVLDLVLVAVGLALFLASTTFITDGTVLAWLIVFYAAGCAVRAVRGRPFALFGLLLFVVGLSVHLMMVIRAGAVPEPAINQTDPDTFANLMSVLRREQYPPLNPLERQAPLFWTQISYYYNFFVRQFHFLNDGTGGLDRLGTFLGPIALGLLGCLHGLRRARPIFWLLAACYLINADGLTLYLNFTDHEVRARDYFYFAAFMYYAVFIGLGTAALLRYTAGPEGPSLADLERQAMPPPARPPFKVQGFLAKVVAAFVAATVLMLVVPQSVKTQGLGFFLFGGIFVGYALINPLAGLQTERRGAKPPPAWGERPWALRLGQGAGLAAVFVIGAVLLGFFAIRFDPVFALACYVAVFGGLFLEYGRAGGEIQPAVTVPGVATVPTGFLPKIAAGLLAVIAALPLLQPGHQKFFEHDRSQNRIAYEYAYNILAGLDENAIVYTNGDNDTFPIWYLQEVEHFRRDVTVVNLSLVNLPWYVKQLKRRDPELTLNFSDTELDALRPRVFQDPETGQVRYVLVRDYVVRDIIDANRRQQNRRPVFFAVTIPRDNMATYFPFLQMEGLAYRLTETRSEDGLPNTDGERLLANVLGGYEFDALMSGDTPTRRGRFAEMAGWQSDRPAAANLERHQLPAQVDLSPLVELFGDNRTDVFRNRNTVNLLGNYPAALARAGFEFLREAETLRLPDGGIAAQDTVRYDRLTERAVVAYELALRFDPYNELVASGWYPMLLLEQNRVDESMAYLQKISGQVSPDVEQQAVLAAMRGLIALGRQDDAVAWLDFQIQQRPEWRFAYDLLFRIYEGQGEVGQARELVERLRQATGQGDPVLEEQLLRLEQRAREQEQQRLEDAVGGEEGE